MSSESKSPDMQKAKTYFDYGNDAALKSNFDYAIDMYKQCCKIVPDNLVYRQALRGIERRKFNNDPGKVGMLVGAKNQPILFRAETPARSRGLPKRSSCVKTPSSITRGTSGLRGWRPRRLRGLDFCRWPSGSSIP